MDDAARVVAVHLKWSMTEVRALLENLEHQGVHLVSRQTTGELCPACAAHWATESGLCVRCETERELADRRRAMQDEQERLEEEATKVRNALKTEHKRMRLPYAANPRRKFDWAVVALYAARHADEWEEVKADIDAAIFAGSIAE